MSRTAKKAAVVVLLLAITACVLALGGLRIADVWAPVGEKHAARRAQAFAHEINYNHADPARAYAYMSRAYKAQLSEKGFVEAFLKERSYPYLTPLFINFDRVELAEGGRTGVAYFSQAARLPGMVFTLRLTYENGNYYVTAFEEFLDGSYLEKFERL